MTVNQNIQVYNYIDHYNDNLSLATVRWFLNQVIKQMCNGDLLHKYPIQKNVMEAGFLVEKYLEGLYLNY